MKLKLLRQSSVLLTIAACIGFYTTIFAEIFIPKSYLLKPSGEYEVGFQDYRFVAGTLETTGTYSCSAPDAFYTGMNKHDFGSDNQVNFCREMMLRVYYPIQNKSAPYASYYLPTIRDLQNGIREAKNSKITEQNLKALENIKTFTVDFTNKPQNNIVNKKFPVLIFSPGYGCQAQLYENAITTMASHGYIVLAISNTFLSNVQFPRDDLSPNGRLVHIADDPSPEPPDYMLLLGETALKDIQFVKDVVLNKNLLSQFVNNMNLSKVGIFGHSIGGDVIVQYMRDNPSSFQAASYFDATPTTFGTLKYDPATLRGFKEPFLRFHAAWWNDPRERSPLGIPPDVQFELLRNNYFVLLSPSKKNTTYSAHISFTDLATMQYHPTLQLFLANLQGDPMQLGDGNGYHAAESINRYMLEYFDLYLKNKPSDNLNSCNALAENTMLECGVNK